VKAKKYPDQIVAENLDFFGVKSWKGLLSQRQKGEDWGKIREKMPEELLTKIGKVMIECRENGFVNPHLKEDEIIWNQMTGDEIGRKHSCKCDLCETDFSSGKCKGKTFRNLNWKKEFKPCWAKEKE
jgi:hypothetical protein